MKTNESQLAAFVGIDWADEKHDVWLWPAQQSATAQPEHRVLEHKAEALLDWINALRARFGGQPVAVCLEQKHGALIHALMAHEFLLLYPINPSTLANYRKAFRPSGAISDKSDAELLAELVRCHRDRLNAWQPDDEQTRKLAALNEKRRKAVSARTALVNQLKSELKSYFPLALEILGDDLTNPLACAFLTRWNTLAALQKSKADTLRRFFFAHNCRRADLIEKRLARIQSAQALCTDPAIVEPAALTVAMFARQLQALHPFIAQYERQIKTLFDSHPDAFLFRDLPGAGPVMAPRLLTLFGTRRERFNRALAIQQYSGIAPVRRQSGRHKHTVHLRWACPKFLRQSAHEFAALSLPSCTWARACYEAQKRAGKQHHAAVRAVAFKWLRILYRSWQERIAYDENRYLQALQKRHPA
jgi:transposase